MFSGVSVTKTSLMYYNRTSFLFLLFSGSGNCRGSSWWQLRPNHTRHVVGVVLPDVKFIRQVNSNVTFSSCFSRVLWGSGPAVNFQALSQGLLLSPQGRSREAGWDQVWSLTQFYSVEFSKSRIDVKKVRFQQTHNQGLRQLLLTVSWDLNA